MAASIKRFRTMISRGMPTYVPDHSNMIYHLDYAGAAVKTVTVPTGANLVLISADADIWCRFDGNAAVVPVSDIVDGLGSILNPGARVLSPNLTFSIAVAAATKVSLEFYGEPQ